MFARHNDANLEMEHVKTELLQLISKKKAEVQQKLQRKGKINSGDRSFEATVQVARQLASLSGKIISEQVARHFLEVPEAARTLISYTTLSQVPQTEVDLYLLTALFGLEERLNTEIKMARFRVSRTGSDFYRRLAHVPLKEGNLEEVKQHFLKALEYDRLYPGGEQVKTLVGLAKLASQQGREEETTEFLQQAVASFNRLRENNASPAYLEAKELVEEILSRPVEEPSLVQAAI